VNAGAAAMVAEATVATATDLRRTSPSRLGGFACLAALSIVACGGLLSKDVPVAQEFQVGGNLPGTGPSLASSALTAPLAASAGDLAHLSSVTVQSVTIESTDQQAINFLDSGKLSLSAQGQPDVTLATLPSLVSAAPTGLATFTVQGSTDLKPYLAAGGTLTAAFTYSPKPLAARGLKLTVVLHASL
jgi:hypothetical protein